MNRCDETKIDIKLNMKKFLKLIKREDIWNDIITKSDILKNTDNINITKFSNKLYSYFKNYKNKTNNFDKFIEFYGNEKNFTGKKNIYYI